MLAADVDDTITTDGKIPPTTVQGFEALHATGIFVALVTGRPAGWAQALAGYLPGVSLAVAENGLVAFDSRGERRDFLAALRQPKVAAQSAIGNRQSAIGG